MKIPFLMVRDDDALILGVIWHDDPDSGPVGPQHMPSPGVSLVPDPSPGGFSRAGHRDTEAAYLRARVVEWVETATLDGARANAWASAKAARDAAEAAPFEFEGAWYDVNKQNVSGAALAALMTQLAGQPFSIDWTLADNSVKTLDGAQVQALGIAMVRHIDGLHATARTLRDLINNAETPDEAYSYTWDTNAE